MKTLLVVPCFNEEQRLDGAAFEQHAVHEPSTAFLFVDDGSTDGTARVLADLCRRAPERLFTMSLEQNSGKAEAVRRGMIEAFGKGASYVAFWDADLATPLSEVASFADVLDSKPACDLVMGARVRLLGCDIRRRAVRHYVGRVFATAASIVLSLPVYDTQCGAKMFRVKPETRALFSEPFCSRWIFDVEILARMIVARGNDGLGNDVVRELPVRQWIDARGSKVHTKDYFRAIKEMWAIRRRYFGRGSHPPPVRS